MEDVKRIRVLLANQPLLMREAVTVLTSDQPAIEVVGEIADPSNVPEMVEQLRPDILVVDDKEVPHLFGDLLRRYPGMRILALNAQGNSSAMYWVADDIQNKPVEYSGRGILNALRERFNFVEDRHSPGQELQE